MVKKKTHNKGRSWHQDRMMESKEPHEKKYKKKSGGLKYASAATRKRVARLGGKASHKRKRR
jgi:hypothetical protein